MRHLGGNLGLFSLNIRSVGKRRRMTDLVCMPANEDCVQIAAVESRWYRSAGPEGSPDRDDQQVWWLDEGRLRAVDP